MTERGILMTPENYGKTEAGTKWMTRRIIKPQPRKQLIHHGEGIWKPGRWTLTKTKCPFGTVGDRLYVKEAYRFGANWDEFKPSDVPKGCDLTYERDHGDGFWGKLRSPMFMPKWAARLWLELTDVRVERLQEISEADAKAEGCSDRLACARSMFAELWESINGPESWKRNDWVWVLSFKKVKP